MHLALNNSVKSLLKMLTYCGMLRFCVGFCLVLERNLLFLRRFLFKLPAAVQVAVLDGFGDVSGTDIRRFFQIGDGAGNFQDAVIGPGGQPQLVDGRFQQGAGNIVDTAVFFDVTVAHAGVTENFGARQPLGLNLAGGGHPLAYRF